MLMKLKLVVKGYHSLISSLLRILTASGVVLLLPVLVGLLYGEVMNALVFTLLGISLIVPTYILSRYIPTTHLSLSCALLVAGISWLLIPLVGAIPYIVICGIPFIDAYFESMSGFTTTGMTLLTNLESLPKTILFWRALTQWVGGMGIVLLTIVIVGIPSTAELFKLYLAEAREVKIRASTWVTVRDLWIIYTFYTLLCTTILIILGMNPFEAITHSLTAIATGGFSTRDASIAAFNNPYIEGVLTVFEFLGATSFVAHYILFNYGVKAFFKYYEVRYYIFLISIASIAVTLDLMLNLGLDVLQAIRYGVFQVVSITTTTGYLTADISSWPPFTKSLLLILMFIGGNICSTAGAIKISRLVIAFKAIVNELQRLYLPPAIVKPIKVDTHVVEEGLVLRVLLLILLYIITVVMGTLILTFLGYDPFSALSAIASAQGNVGPAYISFQSLNTLSKVVLIMYMWLGRLELTPALSVLIPGMWSQARSKEVEM